MKLIGSNGQGKGKNLSNSKKMEFLHRLISSTGAQITFISETRTSRSNSSKLNNRFNIADSFVVPSIGLSCGLWLLWNDEVRVNIKFSSPHLILASFVYIATTI